jgi:hypothetical protein
MRPVSSPCRILYSIGAALVVSVSIFATANSQSGAPDGPVQVLEDFSKAEHDGFPQGWEASRSENLTRQAYRLHREGAQSFLRSTGVDSNVRIFKRLAWDPKAYPVVTWRWRLRSPYHGSEPVAAVFISLDQDFFGIPVSTKYVWSPNVPAGSLIEGGLFRPTQLVLRSGTEKVGEWLEERVNAYDDFVRIHKHDPAPQAWGISLAAGPGAEIDFGPIALARQ